MGAVSELGGRYVAIDDTRLFVVERGEGYPVVLLHGGPGLDHHMFSNYLDPLTDQYRLIFVDQRSQGRSDRSPESTWSISQMARDIGSLARVMRLDRYALLGHSYGAFVALQNAVDCPGQAAQTIISSGIPSVRFLEPVERNLRAFEPVELRERVAASWKREQTVGTEEEVAAVFHDQLPFDFANPLDPRIKDYEERIAAMVYSPDALRYFAQREYGSIEVEDRLGNVTQPVLVLAGRHDRVCSIEAAEATAKGLPNSELAVFEESGHFTFVEENGRYITIVRNFLNRHTA